MAVTITQNRQGPGFIELTWSSDLGGTPTFYVYVDGVLFLTTTHTSHTFQVAPNEHVQIEVLDDTSDPQPAYPGNVWLQWLPVTNAAQYRIDQWNGATWDAVRTVIETGRAVMEHRTPFLDDQTEYRFRVVPIGENLIEGTAREFTIFVVRTPDIPTASATYDDGTGKVTLTAT